MFRVVAALAATFAGLTMLLSFKSHSTGAARSALGSDRSTTAGSSPAGSSPAATGGPSRRASSPSPRTTGGSGRVSSTYVGSAYSTRYGMMQVAAVVRSGRLTDVRVLQETDGGRSHQIDDAALPVLKAEALRAQSADIDIVSGATYTSTGYAHSLQAALDKAGL